MLQSKVAGVEPSTVFTPTNVVLVHEDRTAEDKVLSPTKIPSPRLISTCSQGSGTNACGQLTRSCYLAGWQGTFFASDTVGGQVVQEKTSTGFDAYTMTGVIEDVPSNSSLQFQFVIKGSGDWWDEQLGGTAGNTMHIFFKPFNE